MWKRQGEKRLIALSIAAWAVLLVVFLCSQAISSAPANLGINNMLWKPFNPTQKPFRGMMINKNHPLARGLIFACVMNENGGPSVYDTAGHLKGTFKNSPTWAIGPHGSVVEFDRSSSQYIEFEASSRLDEMTNSELTLVMLLNPRALNYNQTHIAKGDGVKWFHIANLHTDTISSQWDDDVNKRILTADITDANAYYFVVVRKTNSQYELWLNETLEDTTLLNNFSTNNTDHLMLGRSPWNETEYSNAAEVYTYIYDRSLTTEEMAWLHREPYAMFEPIHAAFWGAGVGAETVALDALSGSLSAGSLSVIPGAMQLAMDALAGTVNALGLNVSPGAVQVPLDALIGTSAAQNLTVQVVSGILMDALSLSSEAKGLTVSPGAVQILLDKLATASAAEAATIAPGAVQLAMDTLAGSLTLEQLTVSLATIIALNRLELTATPQSFTLSTGAVQVLLNLLSAALTVPQASASIKAITVSSDRTITVAAEDRTITINFENRTITVTEDS